MTAAVVTLAALALSLVGVLGWLIYGRVAAADAIAEERANHSATTLDRDRVRLERDAFKQQLEIENKRVAALEEVLAHVQSPNSDLDPADVRTRVRRAAAQAATASRASSARAVADEVVPAQPTAAGPDTAAVSGGLDPNERLL